ncbi:MAG: alginate lyase family protein [Chitinophagaceae bacterium]
MNSGLNGFNEQRINSQLVMNSGLIGLQGEDSISPEQIKKELVRTLRPIVMKKVKWAMEQQPVTVTATSSPRSAGGKHDFFSEGDYWWPNPVSADSPYVQRDGMTNPANFNDHRLAMIRFSQLVGTLTSAYVLTGERKYADRVMLHCRAWFADTATRMNPHLLYAQAIKGRVTGRGIGIIDAIQLMEVVRGLKMIEKKGKVDKNLYRQFRDWFNEYLEWVTTHKYGVDEMNAKNNHGTCWVMQVAVFADFTGNEKQLAFCRERFKTVLMPTQFAPDGSFPLELKRTKPYGYSLFNLDAMATICQVLSTRNDNLWKYNSGDTLSMGRSVDYMLTYVADKNRWPFPKDVMYWENWPVAQPFLLFGAASLGRSDCFQLWRKGEHDPQTDEVVRNLPVRNPLLWF